MPNPRHQGFTLLEILVALAILAVALMAASRAIGLSLSSASQVRLTLLADWVAQNRLASHRIKHDWPAIGSSSGSEVQAGIDLRWQEEVSGTPHPQFRRIEVKVLDPTDENHVLRRLVGYASGPS